MYLFSSHLEQSDFPMPCSGKLVKREEQQEQKNSENPLYHKNKNINMSPSIR